MRKAFELAWMNVYINMRRQPRFVAVDDTFFKAPVEVRERLRWDASIGVPQHCIGLGWPHTALIPPAAPLSSQGSFWPPNPAYLPLRFV